MSSPCDDYDTPWKDALTRYFHHFVSFYFPAVEKEIDWEIPCEFLEQELSQVTRGARLGLRRVDKLVRVARRNGPEQWVFVHVDVQGSYDREFAERLFVYNYRIYDRYRKPVASLAVLADSNRHWRPARFAYKVFGCRMGIDFPTVKLSDYADQLPSLLKHENVFALVTVAHLLTQRTRGDNVIHLRYALKRMLVRKLYERGWDRQCIIDLFNIIDWMMHLPDQAQSQLLDEIAEYEQEHGMAYISSFERRGLEKGLERGRQEGQVALLAKLLTKRFGPLPESIEVRLTSATPVELQTWGEAVLDAQTLDSIFAKR